MQECPVSGRWFHPRALSCVRDVLQDEGNARCGHRWRCVKLVHRVGSEFSGVLQMHDINEMIVIMMSEMNYIKQINFKPK